MASKPQTTPCTASEPVTDPLCLASVLQDAESQNSAIFTTCPDGFTTRWEPLLNDHGGPPFEVFCTLPSLHFAMTIFGGNFLLPSTEPCGLTISRFSDKIRDPENGAVMLPSSHSRGSAFATFLGGGRLAAGRLAAAAGASAPPLPSATGPPSDLLWALP